MKIPMWLGSLFILLGLAIIVVSTKAHILHTSTGSLVGTIGTAVTWIIWTISITRWNRLS